METKIKIGDNSSNGKMIRVFVNYSETIEGLVFHVEASVFVPSVDSRAEISRMALEEANSFLKRAISGHHPEGQK